MQQSLGVMLLLLLHVFACIQRALLLCVGHAVVMHVVSRASTLLLGLQSATYNCCEQITDHV